MQCISLELLLLQLYSEEEKGGGMRTDCRGNESGSQHGSSSREEKEADSEKKPKRTTRGQEKATEPD